MAYPEPSSLDDQYGPGAERAEAEAEHDGDIIADVFAEVGEPIDDIDREWGEQLILAALRIARAEYEQWKKECFPEP